MAVTDIRGKTLSSPSSILRRAVATAALWMPVGGRALRNSPDDVVALTEQQVRTRLPQGEQLVVSIRKEDLIGSDDEELTRLVESTDGGWTWHARPLGNTAMRAEQPVPQGERSILPGRITTACGQSANALNIGIADLTPNARAT